MLPSNYFIRFHFTCLLLSGLIIDCAALLDGASVHMLLMCVGKCVYGRTIANLIIIFVDEYTSTLYTSLNTVALSQYVQMLPIS